MPDGRRSRFTGWSLPQLLDHHEQLRTRKRDHDDLLVKDEDFDLALSIFAARSEQSQHPRSIRRRLVGYDTHRARQMAVAS